ncbi:glycosyltransferase family 4 protein [bacterium]|nr:glycosyltransferase family 4 protein [bacterium]
MKIAIVTPHFFNPSGIGTMCSNLASELVKKENMVEVFTFVIPERYRFNIPSSGVKVYAIRNMYAETLNLSQQRHKLRLITWIQTKLYRFLTLLNILKSMISRLPLSDVIHINGYTDLTIVGFLIGKIFNKPIILSFHGTDVWYYKKTFFDLFKRIVLHVNRITCVSKCLQDKLLNDTGAKSDVIPPMTSDCFLSQRGKRTNFLKHEFNADKILLNVKGLIPIYGHELLIRSLPDVLKKYPNLKLVLTGEGPLLEKLKQLVVTLCIKNNVVFAGFSSHEKLVDFYASSDIYVLSSKLESRANVVLESLSCGTPVITTNNPAGIELGNQYHGDVTLIREDTPQVLADTILKILDEGRKVKRSTIAKISNELNTRVIAQKFYDIYRNVTDMGAK